MLLLTRKHFPFYDQNSEHLIREEDKNKKSFAYKCIAYQFWRFRFFSNYLKDSDTYEKSVFYISCIDDLPLQIFVECLELQYILASYMRLHSKCPQKCG